MTSLREMVRALEPDRVDDPERGAVVREILHKNNPYGPTFEEAAGSLNGPALDHPPTNTIAAALHLDPFGPSPRRGKGLYGMAASRTIPGTMSEDGENGTNSSGTTGGATGRPKDWKRPRDLWGRKLTPEGAVEGEDDDPPTLGDMWPWMLPKERERAIQDDPEAVTAAGLSLDDPYAPESTVEYNLDQDLDPDIQIPVGESVWEWERRMLGLPDEDPPWLGDPSMDRDPDYVPPPRPRPTRRCGRCGPASRPRSAARSSRFPDTRPPWAR